MYVEESKKVIKIGAFFKKIGEQTLRNMYTDEQYNLVLWKVG